MALPPRVVRQEQLLVPHPGWPHLKRSPTSNFIDFCAGFAHSIATADPIGQLFSLLPVFLAGCAGHDWQADPGRPGAVILPLDAAAGPAIGPHLRPGWVTDRHRPGRGAHRTGLDGNATAAVLLLREQ